jgi:hypothetical protein
MKRLHRQRHRLCLEFLEGRCLPSTVTNLRDSGPGSLRDAIATTPDGGTVDFQPGLRGAISLTSGEVLINKDLMIEGPGASVITLSGILEDTSDYKVLFIGRNRNVAISGLTIANDSFRGGDEIWSEGRLVVTNCLLTSDSDFGADGIDNNGGTLKVMDSTFSHNQLGGIYNMGILAVVTHCSFEGNGYAGIYNTSRLTVTDCTFSGNSAGGITNLGRATVMGSTFIGNPYGGINSIDGNLTIIDSTFSGNAGGIINGFGWLAITGSTFSGNAAVGIGGGIRNYLGTVAVTDCTFNGNSETDPSLSEKNGGGGIDNHLGTLTVTDSTFSGNSASAGGGIYNYPGGNLTIRNTLLAGNRASDGPDVSGVVNSKGHNLVGDGTGGSGYATTDLLGTAASPIDPKLGPLQDNGGPTQTMALLPGSPAVGAGALTDNEWDQRGPGFARAVNGRSDIGAYEVQADDMPQPPVVALMRETRAGQAWTFMAAPVSARSPGVPLRQAVAVVDRVFASWTSEAADYVAWRARHVAPGLWSLDVFRPEEERE